MGNSHQPLRQIDISVARRFRQVLSEDWLRRVVEVALAAALTDDKPVQVGLVVAGDTAMRKLNREYRGLDEVTDVLSFSAVHPGHWEGEGPGPADRYLKFGDAKPAAFALPPDELPPLGEVIISFPQTRRQAQERNCPVDRELALLIIHGVLHLAGYDHQGPEDQGQMQAREGAALAGVPLVGVQRE